MDIGVAVNNGGFELTSGVKLLLWIGMAVYMLAMLFIGWLSSKKVNNMDDFLVAGRRLPLWMATATLLATWFGAGSSMGVSATVFSDGVGGVLSDPFGASLSLVLAGIFVVGMLRKKGCTTVTDIIERQFGKAAGIYASIWMIPVYVGWLGAQMLGLGTLLHLLTGISVMTGTFIGAAVVLIYTYAGGMWAVTLTDVVQVGIMIIGLIVILPGAMSEAGGTSEFMSRLTSADLTLLPRDAHTFNDYVYYLGSWIVMGLGCMVGQDLIQRSLASKNSQIAVASSVMSGFFYMLVGLIPILIGLAARIILPKYNITFGADADLENQVLPQIAMIVLGKSSPVLLTLFLSALVAAIMSSADSSLLAGASLLCKNVIAPLCPGCKDKKLLITTRAATVVLTFIALFLAISCKSIYGLMINSWISQLVIVFLPVMMALYVPKAGKSTAWATMLTGTAVWLGYTFIATCGLNLPFGELLNDANFEKAITCGAVYGFFSALLAFIACYAGERLSAAGKDE